LLTEGLLLSLLGGAAALFMAWAAARQVTATLAALPGSNFVISLTPDLRVFTAVGIACVVSTIAFSLGPAWTLSKPDLSSGLKTAGLRGRKRLIPVPDLLVSGQIALSLALLVAAALFVRAGAAAAIADPGYTLRDGRMVRGDSNLIFATYTVVGADYLETLGLTLLAGREFTRIEEQTAAASPVALVDQLLVEKLFHGQNPIGQALHLSARPDHLDDETVEIVGIVPTLRDDLTEGVNAHVYVPFGSRYR